MVKEAYVSFDIAKLLKEKGFDVSCYGRYSVRSKEFHLDATKPCNNGGIYQYSAPTQQMAMRWLREVHNIKVNVFYSNPNYAIEYFEPNTQTGVEESVFIGDGYDVYEQACEVAIKYCLENLI